MAVATQGALPLPRHWVRALAVFIGVGAALYLMAILTAGAGASAQALARLGIWTVLAGTLAASTAYLIRFARWQWLIARAGVWVKPSLNLRVYLAGLALTSSPGKVGETLRSLLLLKQGVPVAGSLGAFFADRGADLIGVALLGALAGLVVGARSVALEWLAIGLVVATPLAALALRAGLIDHVLERWTTQWPRLHRWLHIAASPAVGWAALWAPVAFLAYIAFAIAAYGVQALVFAAYVTALGGEIEPLRCVVIFANSMLLGAASMVPGGLGATEAAMVYQLTEAGMSAPDAVAAAIATRLSTLWFAVLLGVVALLTFAGGERADTGSVKP